MASSHRFLKRLSAAAAYRMRRVGNSPLELVWMLHRRLPGVYGSSRRGYVRKVDWRGSSCIKKVFRDKSGRNMGIQRERLARQVFADKDWPIPILDDGDNWIMLPHLPQSCRLDRVIQHMDDATKADVTEQMLSILLDIHTAGYVHGDFHPKNLFWQDSRILVVDFEGFASYQDGARPPFAECYDMTGDRGGIVTEEYLPKHRQTEWVYFLRVMEKFALVLDRDTVLAHLQDQLTGQLEGYGKTPSGGTAREPAYGSFSLPYLSFPARRAQRDSAERLAELGVGPAEAKGMSLLDLGCDVGSLLFEAHKFGPDRCVGIDDDGAKVALAKRIAAFNGLNAIRFIEADDHMALTESVANPFDMVFARLWSLPIDPNELCPFLGKVTKRRLFLEGREDTAITDLERQLRDHGFSAIRQVGRNDGYPLFIAEKG